MSQSKKKRRDSKAVEKAPSAKAIGRRWKWSWERSIIVLVVIALMAVIIGVFHYQNNVAPFRLIVIRVDGTSIRMDYFLKKARLAGVNNPLIILEQLTKEQIIKLEAPGYGIEVSPEDINQQLRRIARGRSETISESEFKEWYRQQLNETGLSDSEYKESIATLLLATRLQEYLARRMPTVAEQVHLYAILVETYEDAEKIRARWEAGEDFADLAREVSLDRESKEKGGDLGWVPRGVMASGLDYVAFELNPGDVSQPLQTGEGGCYLLMVSEKADARELDERSLQRLRDRALEDWLSEEMKFHEITWHGFNNGFDSETNAWITWQLAKE